MPSIETLKYPGFGSLLSYLRHIRERATALKAGHLTLAVTTVDDIIERVAILEDLQK